MRNHSHPRLVISIITLLLFCLPALTQGQDGDIATLKSQAHDLIVAQKFTEALPIYEALAKRVPGDAEVQLYLGFALMGQVANTDDAAARRALRIRAREAFVHARGDGDKSLLVSGMIEGMAEDGSDPQGFSDNAEADRLMKSGEGFFASGKLDDAYKAYTDALAVDPRCYFAALFAGDVRMQQNRFDDAETWYQKAIAIDPMIETGYRYSATPLMKQGKTNAARDRYIQAYITEPYNKLASSGLVDWANVTGTGLAHPKLNIPEITVGADGKTNSTINIDPGSMEGSLAWMAYVTTRGDWQKTKFAKAYPKEMTYRHSLAEEADALRSVIQMAKDVKAAKPDPDIELLSKMDKDGVLEAYILLAIPDQGIAEDQKAYLRTNRDNMFRYVRDYVVHPK